MIVNEIFIILSIYQLNFCFLQLILIPIFVPILLNLKNYNKKNYLSLNMSLNNTSLTNTTETCYIDPSAPQFKRGFDAMLYCAYACIALSYVNINVLVFRLWLILSAVFFIIWGFDPVRAYQLDTLIFNFLFIVINIYQSIPLARQVWPVSLTPFEEEIYDRDFQLQMNKKQFKRYQEKVRTEKFRADKSQICVHSSDFESVIYVAKLYPGWKVCIYDMQGIKLQDLTEGSWLGTIEYQIWLKTKPEIILWGITATLEKDINYTALTHDVKGNSINVASKEGCIINYVDLKVCIYTGLLKL